MDLTERQGRVGSRHPWETSRAQAVEQILRCHGASSRSQVVDIGCGDGYLVEELARRFDWQQPVACDPKAGLDMVAELESKGLRFVRHAAEIPAGSVDWILLLDVLEHIDEPGAFLKQEVVPSIARGGRVLITVPAFQSLFTAHDRYLGHHRRYSVQSLQKLVAAAGLNILSQGYLFSSLLLPRAGAALWERISLKRGDRPVAGVGAWKAPHWMSQLIHGALCLDNQLCLWGNERGISWPGLSIWMTCQLS